ncbi:hypothetical protein [Nocardiopsis synnemataformans]|uniref:hypothetical protein n=1 Tax=Nocardiopsis synnemataformans TaxID=61305 RepID=UPI003EB7B2ED
MPDSERNEAIYQTVIEVIALMRERSVLHQDLRRCRLEGRDAKWVEGLIGSLDSAIGNRIRILEMLRNRDLSE